MSDSFQLTSEDAVTTQPATESDLAKIDKYIEWGDLVRCDTCGELQMGGEGYFPEDGRERLCYDCGRREADAGIISTANERGEDE